MLQRSFILLLALVLSAGLFAGCASAPAAAPAPTALPATAVPATQSAPTLAATEAAPATPTTEPTAVPPTPVPPTPTAEPPTVEPPTATPAALQAEPIQGWCLPENTAVSMASDPLTPPAGAKIGASGANGLTVPNLPGSACVFTYKLNAPAPDGLRLQVYEVRPEGAAGASTPWLTADLKPVEGSPDTVAATLTHSYIIAFPYWEITYQFALVDGSGKELRRDTVNLKRWTPELCWNGRLPSLKTGLCPLQQDQHPWDPWYGKPMPTAGPKGD